MFYSTACKPFFAGIVYNMKPAVSTGLSDDDGVRSGMDEVFTKWLLIFPSAAWGNKVDDMRKISLVFFLLNLQAP